MPSEENERAFCEMLADVLEVPSVRLSGDFRQTPLWGSLTAFAIKISIARRYGRDLTLREISGCATAGELFAKACGA